MSIDTETNFFKIKKHIYEAIATKDFVKYEDIKLPARATKGSAGYDFFATEEFTLKPGDFYIVRTGIKAKFPSYKVLMLQVRSSMGFKYGIRMVNTQGIIDSDYYNNPDNDGHIMIGLVRDKLFPGMTDEPITFKIGDKIGQGIFVDITHTDNDDASEERIGGVGSTGK